MSSPSDNQRNPESMDEGPQRLDPCAVLDKCLFQIRVDFESLQARCDELRVQRDLYESEVAKQVQELTNLRQSVLDLETRHITLRNSYETEVRRLHGELDQLKLSKVSESSEDFPSQNCGRGRGVRRGRGRGLELVARREPHPHPERGGGRRLARHVEYDGDGDVLTASSWNPVDHREVLDPRTPLGQLPPTNPVVDGGSSRGSDPVQGHDGERGGGCSSESKQDRAQELPLAVALPEPRLVTSPVSVPLTPLSHPTAAGEKDNVGLPSTCTALPPSHPERRPRRRSSSLSGPAHSGSPAPVHKNTNGFTGPRPRSPASPTSNSHRDPSNSVVVATVASLHHEKFGATAPNPVDLWTDPRNVPPAFKIEGHGWLATFNPWASRLQKSGEHLPGKRKLDIRLSHTFEHDSPVCCVRFSPNGKYLATGCQRDSQIYCTETGLKVCVLADAGARTPSDPYIRGICFSPEGNHLATGAEDNQIKLWNIHANQIQTVFHGHEKEVYCVDFSHDGRTLVSGSGDGTVRTWDVNGATGQLCQVLTVPKDPEDMDSGVTSATLSPDGRFVVAGSLCKTVCIWDIRTGELVESLKGHHNSVYSVAYTLDGKGIVSGSLDNTIKYWDVRLVSGAGSAGQVGLGTDGDCVIQRGSKCMMTLIGHTNYVLSVAVSGDGKWIASGSKDSRVRLWDAKTGIAQCVIQGHRNSVISVDFSPMGNVFATGSGDHRVGIWKCETF